MASDRHGKHNKPTIAFRVTPYCFMLVEVFYPSLLC